MNAGSTAFHCTWVICLSATRCADWDYIKPEGKRSCWDRPGAGFGETELNRLYYRLGWTRGWYKGALRDHTFGLLADEFSTADLKSAKAKLLNLARKYDRA